MVAEETLHNASTNDEAPPGVERGIQISVAYPILGLSAETDQGNS